MTQAQQIPGSSHGRIFGVPFGDLGWFASLLMTLASGFLVFFAATFVGIFSLLFYGAFAHKAVNYTVAYMKIGIPAGAVALVVVGGFLGSLWVKRITGKAS